MKTNTAKKIGGNKRVAKDIGKTVAAFVLFLLYMIPFLLVIINSLKRKISIVKTPLSLVDDKGFQFVNYSEAFQEMQFLKAFGNSIMVVACSVALLIIFRTPNFRPPCNRKSGTIMSAFSIHLLLVIICRNALPGNGSGPDHQNS